MLNHNYPLKYSIFHILSQLQLCTQLLADPAPGLQLCFTVPGMLVLGAAVVISGEIFFICVLYLSTGTGRLFSHYGVDGEQQFSAEIVEKVLVLRQITFL